MKYAGWAKNGTEPVMEYGLTALDILQEFLGATITRDVKITSCKEAISIPDALKDLKVIGSVMAQDGDDWAVGRTFWVIEDGLKDVGGDTILRAILELDSCGSGQSCHMIPMMVASGVMEIEYAVMNSDGEEIWPLIPEVE